MKNKTDAEKAKEFAKKIVKEHCDNMLTKDQKLNTSEKHVNETPNNEHVLDALDSLDERFNFDSERQAGVNYRTIRDFIQSTQDEFNHVKRCKKFESNLQREILDVGVQYVDVPKGKTVSVIDAWEAIQERLAQQTVDVEVLKQYPDDGNGDDDNQNYGWNNCIDHLHKNGHLGSIPDDMVLVPREPKLFVWTDKLYEAFDRAGLGGRVITMEDLTSLYKAMIQASEVK